MTLIEADVTRDWLDYATLIVLIAGTLATTGLGIAAFLVSRSATRTAEAAFQATQAASRRTFADALLINWVPYVFRGEAPTVGVVELEILAAHTGQGASLVLTVVQAIRLRGGPDAAGHISQIVIEWVATGRTRSS